MTPTELDAIVARAASVYPEDAGWDGDEAERALTTVTEDVPALAAALREAWQERDAALTLAVDIADAVEAEAHKERARIVAQTSRSLVDLARCEGHAAGANRIACALRDLLHGSDCAAAAYTAPMREQLVARTQERDAALAAVDAVRADYAPRREPPTAEEVRAVSRLWGRPVVAMLLRTLHGPAVEYASLLLRVADDGVIEAGDHSHAALVDAESWLFIGPTGPVAWSELAALVARGGDRG